MIEFLLGIVKSFPLCCENPKEKHTFGFLLLKKSGSACIIFNETVEIIHDLFISSNETIEIIQDLFIVFNELVGNYTQVVYSFHQNRKNYTRFVYKFQ